MVETVRVLIVEHEPLVRRGLLACFAADRTLEIAGSVATAAEGYTLADESAPDVVLVGTTLPDAPGLAVASEMRRRFPGLATVVVAANASDDELVTAIRAGAAAYSGQDVDEELLIQIIKRAATGEYVINEQVLAKPSVAAQVLELFHATTSDTLAPPSVFAPLTNRELEILRKVSTGLTNDEIGVALGISNQTVKNHVTSILRKLVVNDRTHAVVTALRRGWLSLEETDPSSDRGARAGGGGGS